MTASPKGRIVFASEMKASTALDASTPAFDPSYRGFTVQGTPSPPPKTHRKMILRQSNTIKLYPNQPLTTPTSTPTYLYLPTHTYHHTHAHARSHTHTHTLEKRVGEHIDVFWKSLSDRVLILGQRCPKKSKRSHSNGSNMCYSIYSFSRLNYFSVLHELCQYASY